MNKPSAVLAFLVVLSVITYLDRVCLSVAGVRMQQDLGIAPQHWGWVLGVFSLGYGLFEIPTGALGDRLGHRRVLTRIVVWWSAFTVLTGVASNYYLLLLTRFLFGAGEAGAYPNMAGTIGRWFPPTGRARAQGAVWAASRVGGALSPLIVVPLMAALGWRAAFYAFGLIGVIWALLWYAWYRDPPDGQPGTAHADAGAPWAALCRSRQLWLIMAMAWCYGWGANFYLTWLHTYLEKGLAGGVLSDRLSQRYGTRIGRRLVGSTSLAVSALLILTTALLADKYAGVATLALGYGAMDCMLPSSWANCLDVGGRHAGVVSGAMNSVVQAGGFISGVLFGYLVEWFGSYDAPLFPIAAMMFVSAFLFSRIDPTRPLIPNAEESVCV